jgi:hypothetical protein
MPSEHSHPRRQPIGKSAIPPATGRPEGANPEVSATQDILRRQTSPMEVTLADEADEFFRKIFKKRESFKYPGLLKNGATIEMATGYLAWEKLNRMLSTNPELIAAAQAKLRGEEVSSEIGRELQRAFMTGPDGELLPDIRDVLISGYQETNDGPVITNPFKLDTQVDRMAFEDMEKHQKSNRMRLLKRFGLLPGDPDGPPPPTEL